MNEYMRILGELGYDINLDGAVLFADLLEDCVELVKSNKSDEEIKELLPRYYLENYHFYYEIGRRVYLERLNKFCSSRVIYENTDKLLIDGNTNLEDNLIFFARYFSNLKCEKKEIIEPKKILKKKIKIVF